MPCYNAAVGLAELPLKLAAGLLERRGQCYCGRLHCTVRACKSVCGHCSACQVQVGQYCVRMGEWQWVSHVSAFL